MKYLWLILFAMPLLAQDIYKHNISLGILDDKTGFSFIGYTYNIKNTEMDEFFIGGGTMIMGFTGSVGWKHYYKKSKLSLYSTVSGQGFIHFGGSGFMPTMALGVEYKLTKFNQVKFGYFGGIHLGGTSDESGDDIGGFPFIGLSRKF
tara:strand:+ start:48 stop:491 length:444 start_codon:yes stop_codon:yes gene_type:complete